MIGRKTYLALAAIAAILSAPSCEHRPVFPEGTLLDIRITGLQPRPDGTYPELFEAIFYDTETGLKVSSDFIGTKGGEIHLAAGEYKYIIHNFDLESTYLDDMDDYALASARTGGNTQDVNDLFRNIVRYDKQVNGEPSMSTEQRGTEQEVIYEPDPFYVASGTVTIPHRNTNSEVISMSCTPVNSVRKAALTVSGIRGAEYISSIMVYVTNISAAIKASDLTATGDGAAVYLPCSVTGRNEFGTTFEYFGRKEGGRCVAFVFVMSLDGTKLVETHDLTIQIASYKAGKDHNLKINCSMKVPKPNYDGEGFQPTLDDWNDETVPVPIGQ